MGFKLAIILGLAAFVAVISASGYNHHPRPHQPHHHHQPQSYHPPRSYSYTVKNWSAWGAYGACSVTCGGGEQKRYRTCKTTTVHGYGKDQDNCVGPTYSRRRCNTQCCPVDGAWGRWSHWANKSSHGYQKVQIRTRHCNYPAPKCGGRYCYGAKSQTRKVHVQPSHY
ncbi:HMCN1 [Bugula neritina]|uniref:HMCN1 n=1 Tax=Bugula neritina TaxID=10212 RepID=A0A7J7JJC7_BUGNE|nr:HMCN1 [Bugula neritina]